jgi:ribonuclease HII
MSVYLDEVGRGCLWGPVVAAAVIDPDDGWEDPVALRIRDSKKVPEKERHKLSDFIQTKTKSAIGISSAEEIEETNILAATMKAMHRALDILWTQGERWDTIVVDGNYFTPYVSPDAIPIPHRCVVKGDATVKSIAAASIVAKVYRDNWVKRIVEENPEWEQHYGLLSNKGYGTLKHRTALKQYGHTAYHRKTFAGVLCSERNLE